MMPASIWSESAAVPAIDDIAALVDRYARALAAYQRNAQTTAIWADVSWMTTCIDSGIDHGDHPGFAWIQSAVPRLEKRHISAISLALLNRLEIRHPNLNALVGPFWSSLDTIPVAMGVRVLRARALIFRRMEVRRLLDVRSRVRLSEWAGMPIEPFVFECPGAPDIASLALTARIPPLHRLDADALSREGLALLLRDLDVERPPFPLLRLSFERDLRLPEWLRQIDRALDQDGSARLMEGLPEWLQGWGWVFG